MTVQPPGQGRSLRHLPWRLLVLVAAAGLVMGAGLVIGWVVFHPATGAGSDFAGPVAGTRAVFGADAVVQTLVVSGTVTGKLVPGGTRPLPVSIHNPGFTAARVLAVHVAVEQPAARACRPAWFRAIGRVPPGFEVPAGVTRQVMLGLELRDLPDLAQDACKGLQLRLAISVDAAAAPA